MSNNNKKGSRKPRKKTIPLPSHLEHINIMAAGIDIGSESHFVAVPEGCDEQSVREFKSFTPDLYELCNWLKKCDIKTVAMESTGVYWIPLYELLESKGFEVKLVDARKIKNVSGRKTDVLDCQWLQQLHTYGLLSGAFRPNEQVTVLRSYVRQRNMLIENAARHIQHMQKAMIQMNIQLSNVLSDITGVTGMKIIRAITAGEKDPKKLAQLRHKQCKNSEEMIEKSLTGSYREEHIFSLTQALELYDVYQDKILACDKTIEQRLGAFEERVNKSEGGHSKKRQSKSNCKNELSFDAKTHLIRICGVDLTQKPSIEASSALKLISEIGLDLSAWKSSKQFAAWLGLSPDNRISGGKILRSKTKKSANRAATVLRIAANTLYKSKSALGAFYRRMKSRLGPPKAITAAAHKLAVIIYSMLKEGREYVDIGQSYYEEKYRKRQIKNLTNRAREFGYSLIALPEPSGG